MGSQEHGPFIETPPALENVSDHSSRGSTEGSIFSDLPNDKLVAEAYNNLLLSEPFAMELEITDVVSSTPYYSSASHNMLSTEATSDPETAYMFVLAEEKMIPPPHHAIGKATVMNSPLSKQPPERRPAGPSDNGENSHNGTFPCDSTAVNSFLRMFSCVPEFPDFSNRMSQCVGSTAFRSERYRDVFACRGRVSSDLSSNGSEDDEALQMRRLTSWGTMATVGTMVTQESEVSLMAPHSTSYEGSSQLGMSSARETTSTPQPGVVKTSPCGAGEGVLRDDDGHIIDPKLLEKTRQDRERRKPTRTRVVKFEYPPISSLKQCPRVAPEDLPQLFFTEEELEQLEEDRRSTYVADDVEIVAVSQSSSMCSSREGTPPPVEPSVRCTTPLSIFSPSNLFSPASNTREHAFEEYISTPKQASHYHNTAHKTRVGFPASLSTTTSSSSGGAPSSSAAEEAWGRDRDRGVVKLRRSPTPGRRAPLQPWGRPGGAYQTTTMTTADPSSEAEAVNEEKGRLIKSVKIYLRERSSAGK